MKATTVVQTEKMEEKPCVICEKMVTGFYGRWGNTGTCSKKCEIEQARKVGAIHAEYIVRLEAHRGATRGEPVTSKT